MMGATSELDVLPAQIPLTLEHLFPILSNSNAKDRAGGPFFVELTHLKGAQRQVVGGGRIACGDGQRLPVSVPVHLDAQRIRASG